MTIRQRQIANHGRFVRPADTSPRPIALMSVSWVVGIASLTAVIYFVLRFNDLPLFVTLLQRANVFWLLLALLCQGMTYVFAALVWNIALARSDPKLPLTSLLKIGFLQIFANQVLPTSGLTGTLIVIRALKARGVKTACALSGVLIDTFTYYAVYLILALVSFTLIWRRRSGDLDWLPVLVAFVLLAGAILFCLAIVGRKRQWMIPPFFLRWRPFAYLAVGLSEMDVTILRDFRINLTAAVCQFAVFLLDAGTLWSVARSIGLDVDLLTSLTSFLVTSVVATIAPLPMGLGSFEGASTMLLHAFGAGPEAALAATLMFRGLTLWLPMIPGFLFFRSELMRMQAHPDNPGKGATNDV
ncbi:lysylphosphatidylglycerol synthase transmembrane domain-containing protein [Agrobacterium vitis]